MATKTLREPSYSRDLGFRRDREISSTPGLFRELQLRWLEQGDTAARDRLFVHLMDFACNPDSIRRQVKGYRLAWDDVRQEMTFAVMKTINEWSPDGGASPTTYLFWQRRARMQRMDSHSQLTERAIRRHQRKMASDWKEPVASSSPDPLEHIASPDNVEEQARDFSLRAMITEAVDSTKIASRRPELVTAILGRAMSEDPRSLREIAESNGLSGERVRQLQDQLFSRLRVKLTAMGVAA